MSHGDDRDCILGVDNRITSVRTLMREFQAERCPSLKGKPKILIIQTCRGYRQSDVERFDDLVESINADPTEFDLADNSVRPFSLDSSLSKSVFPPETDFLLAFATVPGYVSFRSETSGAFFIQVLFWFWYFIAFTICQNWLAGLQMDCVYRTKSCLWPNWWSSIAESI